MKSNIVPFKPSEPPELCPLSAKVIHAQFGDKRVSLSDTIAKTTGKRPAPKETRSKLMPCVLLREYELSAAWILDYVNLAGKPTHKTLGNAKDISELDACMRAKKILEDIRDGINPFAGDIPFGEYFDTVRAPWSLANKRSAKDEIAVFNRYVRRKLGRLLLRQIRAHHIQAMIDELQSGETPTKRGKTLAAGTVYQAVAVTKGTLKWAFRRGDIAADPTLSIRQVKLNNTRHVRFSVSELAAIGVQLESAPPHVRLLFVMLLAIAVRISELLNARHDDIDEDACTLMLRDTKSGRPFLVPCPPVFMQAYAELKTLRRPGNLHLFASSRGTGPISAPRSAFKEILEAAGITERRIFHDARRTAASEAIKTPGVSVLDVSRSLNHASVIITEQRYLVTGDERIRHTLTQSSDRLYAMLRRDIRVQLRPTVPSVFITTQVRLIFAGRPAMN